MVSCIVFKIWCRVYTYSKALFRLAVPQVLDNHTSLVTAVLASTNLGSLMIV